VRYKTAYHRPVFRRLSVAGFEVFIDRLAEMPRDTAEEAVDE
jgi:hypothetical protein